MAKNTTKAAVRETGKRTTGLDLGDQHSDYYTLDQAGEEVKSGRVKTSREALAKRFGGGEPMRVVIEAGTHSPWVSRLLARGSFLKDSIPLPRGTKELHLSPNVQAPDYWLAPLVWTGLWFVTTLTAFVLDPQVHRDDRNEIKLLTR